MPITAVSAGRLALTQTASTFTFSNVTLPAGRLIIGIGWRTGGAGVSSTSLTHPALASAVKVLEPTGVESGSRGIRLAVYDCQSNSGTGNLVFQFSTSIWALVVHTYQISGVASGIGATTSNSGIGVASVQITPTLANAGMGIAIAVAEPVVSNATLSISSWNDVSQTDSTNAGYLHLCTVGEETSPSGQTLTASMSSGNLALVSFGAILFGSLTASTNAAALLGG